MVSSEKQATMKGVPSGSGGKLLSLPLLPHHASAAEEPLPRPSSAPFSDGASATREGLSPLRTGYDNVSMRRQSSFESNRQAPAKRYHLEDELAAIHRKSSSARSLGLRPLTPPDVAATEAEGMVGDDVALDRQLNQLASYEEPLEEIDDGDADRRLLNSYCELVEQAMLGGEAGVPGQSKAMTASYILNPSGVEEQPEPSATPVHLTPPGLPAWMPSCPQLVAQDGSLFPLQRMQVEATLELHNAQLTLTGLWQAGPVAGDCILMVPIPEGGRVTDFEVSCGSRLLSGAVVPRAMLLDAQAPPRHAPTALLNDRQWSPSVFRLEVPRVEARSMLQATVRCSTTMRLLNNCYHLHVPLTFPQQMVPSLRGLQDRVAAVVRLPRQSAGVWECSHVLTPDTDEDDTHLVLSDEASAPWPNQDFVFCYQLGDPEVQPLVYVSPVALHDDEQGRPLNRLALYISPGLQAAPPTPPREMVFLLMRSPKLTGPALEEVRAALDAALDTLRDGDQFTVLCAGASGLPRLAWPELQPVSTASLPAAKAWLLHSLEESSAMHSSSSPPDVETVLRQVLGLLGPARDTALRCCLLATDYYVPDEAGRRAVCYVREHNDGVRFMSLGLGPAVNAPFLQLLADVSQGLHREYPDISLARDGIAAFVRDIERCVLTDVNVFVEGSVDLEIAPDPPPDLYQGHPVHVVGMFHGDVPETALVTGTLPSGTQFCQPVPVRQRPPQRSDWLFDAPTVARYAAHAWLQNDPAMFQDAAALSVAHAEPYGAATAWVVADGDARLLQALAAQRQQAAPLQGSAALLQSGVKVRPVGSTAAELHSLAASEGGRLQEAIRAAEAGLQRGIAAVLQAEHDSRLDLVWAEVGERQRGLRAVRLLVRRQDAQQRAVMQAEAQARNQVLRQVEAGYRAVLKFSRYERKGFGATPSAAAAVAAADLPSAAAAPVAAAAAAAAPTPPPAGGDAASRIAAFTAAPEEDAPRSSTAAPAPPPAAVWAMSLGAVEMAEQAARQRLRQKWEAWAATWEAQRAGDQRLVAQHAEARRQAQQYPLLAARWRSSHLRSPGEPADAWRCNPDDVNWLLGEMQQHPADARLAMEVLGLLARWASEPELHSQLPQSNVVAEVVRTMRRHPECVPVQHGGCVVLTCLVTASTLPIAEREGALSAVLHALRGTASPVPALDCIAALATLGVGLRRQLARKGVIPLIVRAMELGAGDPGVLAPAIAALAALGIAADAATDAQTVIATQGGLDLIFQAMRRHPSNAPVLTAAVQALDHLSAFNNFNKAILLSGGAPSLILSSMMSFPTHAKLLSHAISALSTLASNVYACEAIVKQGGIPLVLECMSAFPNRVKLLSKAQHCLELLQRVERDAARGVRPLAAIRFVRCILLRGPDPKALAQPPTKLLGFCGVPALPALRHSIEAMFEAGPLTLFFDAEAHGRVLLVEGTLPGFLRSAQRRLYCAPEDAAAQLMESRPTSPASLLDVTDLNDSSRPRR